MPFQLPTKKCPVCNKGALVPGALKCGRCLQNEPAVCAEGSNQALLSANELSQAFRSAQASMPGCVRVDYAKQVMDADFVMSEDTYLAGHDWDPTFQGVLQSVIFAATDGHPFLGCPKACINAMQPEDEASWVMVAWCRGTLLWRPYRAADFFDAANNAYLADPPEEIASIMQSDARAQAWNDVFFRTAPSLLLSDWQRDGSKADYLRRSAAHAQLTPASPPRQRFMLMIDCEPHSRLETSALAQAPSAHFRALPDRR